MSSHVKNMRLTCSAGVYRITNPTMGVSTMCDRALLALLTVKNSYNDKVARYEDDMLRGLLAEEQLERDMERGISEGQFAVYFQPQVNYDTGYIIGAEALVRWKHPQRGLIQPGEFIPLFEKNGFITRLDEYVWRRTAEYMRSWLDMDVWDTPVPVSVNISRLDIYDTGICEKIKAIVDEYGVPPELFKLEITESAYMDNPHQLISVVKDLKALGFSVEMDDFGSGYSSLNTLKDVPVDVLKLDTRFLCSGEDDARGGSILSSVIRMAHWLKLPVIAEGVETRTQADYLKSLGCFYMQGYYFGRPMPTEDFEKLLTGCRASDSHRYDSVDLAGIAAFWDPSRQTALLFNSFVGGAAILEYQNGMAEILRANDRFYKELGTAREDYLPLQQDTLARFEEKNRAIYLGMLRQAIATRDEAECELESLPLKPGCDSLWTRNRVRLLTVNGDCYLFYVAVENINKRKKTEEALRVSREEMELAISQMGKVIASLDIPRKTLTMPEGYARKHGVAPVVQGVPEAFLKAGRILPADQAAYLAFYKDIYSGVRSCSVSIRSSLADGGSCWERYDSFTVSDETGRPLRAVIAVEDVTARIERESDQQRNYLLTARSGTCVFSYDTIGDVLHFQSYLKDRGVVQVDIPEYYNSIPNDRRIHPDSAAPLQKMIREACASPHTGTLDYQADNWDRGMCWSRLFYASLADDSGKVCRIVGQIENIQSEKDRDDQLRRIKASLGGRLNGGEYNALLVERVLTILYKAQDTARAMQRVLAAIGGFYDVSRAYIFEDSPDHRCCSNTYEWCAPGVTPQKDFLQNLSYIDDIAGYYDNFNRDGVFFCPDITKLPQAQVDILRPQGIRSMLQCTLLDKGERWGYIGFDDCHENRSWTREQAATLTIVARLLGVFLSKFRISAEAGYSDIYETALDSLSAFFYVVDAKTHRLKYESAAVKRVTGSNGEGRVCFRQYMGRSSPCEKCPLTKRGDSGAVELIRPDGVRMLTGASPLLWRDKEAFVVTCVDITKYKP